jgi:hypothetical protein
MKAAKLERRVQRQVAFKKYSVGFQELVRPVYRHAGEIYDIRELTPMGDRCHDQAGIFEMRFAITRVVAALH